MNRRVFFKADGTVAVMVFATTDPKLIKRDTEAFLEANPGSVYEDDVELPDRRFRNCWTKGDKSVVVDMPKAREQRLNEIRTDRNVKLAASDGEMLRAQEQGKPVEALKAERQRLRDLPATVKPLLDRITNPDELARFDAKQSV